MIKSLKDKVFKLEEICAISNQFSQLLSLPFEAKYKWPIQQIANPFIEKAKEVIDQHNVIVAKYLKDGETTVSGDENIRKVNKEIADFYKVTQEMQFQTGDRSLIPEKLVIGDISLIQYFFTNSEEAPTKAVAKKR